MTISTLTASAEVPAWLPTARPRHDPYWVNRARCANDPDQDRWIDLPPLRIRGRINPAYDARLNELAAECARCPARPTCAWQALTNDVVGVWAGTDEADRADLREALGLPDPVPLTVPTSPEEQERTRTQRDTWLRVRRLARTSLTSAAIAAALELSPMTVSRLLNESTPEPVPCGTRAAA